MDPENKSRTERSCIVCGAHSAHLLLEVDNQIYFRCQRCAATFLDPSMQPNREVELAHYQTHENDPSDGGYRAFLSRLANPLLERLQPSLKGLDYGCGPGPALAQMMRDAGHQMAIYDPFFEPGQGVLEDTYDFITCTEVAEHFHHPYEEFRRLNKLLRPGGWLGIMTMFQTDNARFANWHYRKDPTHVVFYRVETMQVIARDLGWSCDIPAKNIVLFQKPSLN